MPDYIVVQKNVFLANPNKPELWTGAEAFYGVASPGDMVSLIPTGSDHFLIQMSDKVGPFQMTAATALFTPATYAGTDKRAWIDMSDATKRTVTGSQVTEIASGWSYTNGGGALIKATRAFATGPSTGVATLGGKGILSFATDQSLVLPSLDISGAQARTVFMVVGAYTGAVGSRTLMNMGAAGTGMRWRFTSQAVNGGLSFEWNGGNAQGTGALADSEQILCITHDGSGTVAGTKVSINGATPVAFTSNTTAINTTVDQPTYIGAFIAGKALGPCAEFIATNGLMSDANIAKFVGYLGHKYSLTGYLPSGFAYKSTPPTA